MVPLFHINYKVDKTKLLAEALIVKKSAKGYTDSRYPDLKINDWLIGHSQSAYSYEVMRDLNVEGRPRFYWLRPNAVIPEHVDNGTLCGINFILTNGASPISFSDRDYYYEAALIDTTVPHRVKNNENERIMFKISIFNETFEQVAEKIKKYLK